MCKKGICAIYGLIKETADWKIQAYQFSIKKLWTVEKAKSWLKINNKVVKSIYSEDGLHMVIIGGKIKDE